MYALILLLLVAEPAQAPPVRPEPPQYPVLVEPVAPVAPPVIYYPTPVVVSQPTVIYRMGSLPASFGQPLTAPVHMGSWQPQPTYSPPVYSAPVAPYCPPGRT